MSAGQFGRDRKPRRGQVIRLAEVRPGTIDTRLCQSCRHRYKTNEAWRTTYVFDENGQRVKLPDNATLVGKTLVTSRCAATITWRKDKETSPFANANVPILTCREAQLNDCRGGRLYEPIS